MKSNKGSMAGGLFVYAMLVIVLAVPPLVGYYALPKNPESTVHADASATD